MEWITLLRDMAEQFATKVAAYLPNLLLAVVVLFVGWLAAKFLGLIVARIARRTGITRRFFKAAKLERAGKEALDEKGKDKGARILGKIAYYIALVCVIGIVFNIVNIPVISEPLGNLFTQLTGAVPNLVHAFLILAVAWVIALVCRLVIKTFLTSINLDARLSDWGLAPKAEGRVEAADADEEDTTPLAETASKLVYYLILLFALPGFLSALKIEAVAAPIQEMFGKLMTMLPNIFGAAITILIGYIVARIVREIVSNFLAAVGLDRASEKIGVTQSLGGTKASGIVGTIVFVLILIPFITSALENIHWKAISDPVTGMLNKFMGMIPSILGAAVVLLLGYVLGRIVGDFVGQLLRGVGFDGILSKIGLGSLEPRTKEGLSLSTIAGKIVMYVILIFALTEAFEVLRLRLVSELFSQFLLFLPRLFVGILIIGVGFAVAQIVYKMLSVALETSAQSVLLANGAKYAVITFAAFMALQQIGFAESIIVTAFSALFGAFCLAAALAVGLGARGIAADYLEERFGRKPSSKKKS